ncbi:MCE family protein [Gandjariella thermophila]|uniref:ABC transporter substrate-binding protein n=1 Tax=Gandjariella thermophila TaxID=1931992 RepID=A0A4D4JD29_9PSEU|nr:MCE family protein [Gandjariella thermophila]GDY31773.1 ABC transporter substrate-binding protein [Gandjariella thermophila]
MSRPVISFHGAFARSVAFAAVVVLLLAAGVWWVLSRPSGTRVTAYFPESIGLYAGSDVRVLGMPIGTVTGVTPQGPQVRVDMTLDPKVPVPATAKAVAVAPSLVSDRYVQFTPPYDGGPRMTDGTVLPLDRTAAPLELDDINKNLDRMMTALGPNGANSKGALSDALTVEAANLRGNGEAIHQMIIQLGQAESTLSGSKEDWFGTIDHLQKFNKALADSDGQVRQFNQQFADAMRFLAGERGDLGRALHDLGPALEDVQAFIRNNRDQIKSNVDNLAGVTKVLVDQRAALAEVLDDAPLGLSNLANTYDAASQTLQTRSNINELTNPPIVLVCKLLQAAPPTKPVPPVLTDACRRLAPVINGAAPLPSPADVVGAMQQGKPPPLPLPLVNVLNMGGQTAGRGGR